MKFIKLTQQKIAIVDDDRYDALIKFPWRAVQSSGGWYAKSQFNSHGREVYICMHRFVARTPFGMVTHHINHNTLDNRFENLKNMKKKDHDDFHINNTIKIKFAPVTEVQGPQPSPF